MACTQADSAPPPRADSMRVVPEATVRPLPMSGPMNADDAEISGLTWFRDTLVVLPQYPRRNVPDQKRRIYGIPRTALERALRDSTAAPLSMLTISMKADGIENQEGRYEGCEAIAFSGNRVFVLVETKKGEGKGMGGTLIGGTVDDALTTVTLDASTPRSVPTQVAIPNMAYEALTIVGDTVVALYEANGAHVNGSASAYAFQFRPRVRALGPRAFPTLEYRITDATETDADGRFWVMNYFYPGERDVLNPALDSLSMKHGVGASHVGTSGVERLVEYRFTPKGIRRTDTPPVWLTLTNGDARNWEGVVRFGDGFLVATDRYPETLLAYVEPPRPFLP